MSRPGDGRPTLRRNILATYASQAYVALAGLVLVPTYLHFLGAEAFGLVGLFAVLQASFALLDFGLTPTIGRETARFHANPEDPTAYRRLFRALQVLFAAVAVVGATLLVSVAGAAAEHWIRSVALPAPEVRLALQMMGMAVAFRWMGGLYRGVIAGSEQLVWMGRFNIAMATARFGGVLAALLLFGATPTVFFAYQFAVALVELLGLAWKAYALLPPLGPGAPALGWSVAPVRPLLRFSLAIAGTSAIWVLVTQTDKLILSRLLTLQEYGYFSLGVLVAGCVLVATTPVATPLLPRLAHLEARGEDERLRRLYRTATQGVCILAFSLGAMLASFPEEALRAWTGDAAAARAGAPVLAAYALGNAVLAVAAFPYYLQYAKGDLRLHLRGNLLLIVVLVPALVAATAAFGARGAGWVWLAANALFFLAWIPVSHHRFAPGLHLDWLREDVLPIALAAVGTAFLLHLVVAVPDARLPALATLAAAGAATLLAACGASSVARRRAATFFRRRAVAGRA